MGARQYVRSLGRFLQVDPIEEESANDDDYVEVGIQPAECAVTTKVTRGDILGLGLIALVTAIFAYVQLAWGEGASVLDAALGAGGTVGGVVVSSGIWIRAGRPVVDRLPHDHPGLALAIFVTFLIGYVPLVILSE